MGTFVARPIVAYDGKDDSGLQAEVLVQKGLVNVDQKNERKNKDQVNFKFTADNLKHGIDGWLNKSTDPDMYKMLTDAYDNDDPIYVRIEKKRKPHVDRKIPIKEISSDVGIAKENIVKIIAGVRLNEEDDWLENTESVTVFSEDSFVGSVKASASDFPTKKETSPWNDIEAPPYKTRNNDGEVNPGSDAVAAVTNIYTFVQNHLTKKENGFDVDIDTDEGRKKVMEVTYKVISITNKAQVKIFDGKLHKPDMSKRSHVRARSLIFHAMENSNKLKNEYLEDKDALTEWSEEVLERVVKMWSWSIKTVEKIDA